MTGSAGTGLSAARACDDWVGRTASSEENRAWVCGARGADRPPRCRRGLCRTCRQRPVQFITRACRIIYKGVERRFFKPRFQKGRFSEVWNGDERWIASRPHPGSDELQNFSCRLEDRVATRPGAPPPSPRNTACLSSVSTAARWGIWHESAPQTASAHAATAATSLGTWPASAASATWGGGGRWGMT